MNINFAVEIILIPFQNIPYYEDISLKFYDLKIELIFQLIFAEHSVWVPNTC